MSAKQLTIITSDLHMGGGPSDPGDDFVYEDGQFLKFIKAQQETTEWRRGQMELILNGDFLEFAQVRPEAYTLRSSKFWCSEAESLAKLECILRGHAEIFAALRAFQENGNLVTIAAGNHDVDLYWPGVKGKVEQASGAVCWELGSEWYYRYLGRLAIAHGQQLDPANTFQHWGRPVLVDGDGEFRLEMCPGTLFVVKFVNELEAEYPFADNLHPVTALAEVLWREDRPGYWTAARLLSRFCFRHPAVTAEKQTQDQDSLEGLRKRLAEVYREVRSVVATDVDIREALSTDDGLNKFVLDVVATLPTEGWEGILGPEGPATLEKGARGRRTLEMVRAGFVRADEAFRKAARKMLGKGAQVVVLGHTHLPDMERTKKGAYFNPGSWTRYANAEATESLTMDDLKNEEDFPYQLNYVRVEQSTEGALGAEMICFEQKQGRKFRS
jgi:UDP-2,3-diacylglucosamine pyrophosphatase LpxH